ncbi:MAG: purine-binding chemotaxis protein CheW [Proteobacteria bacterium]|nr:purine-binding chemotaxis protein CheW [Pseudomonadota bacterium]
MRFDILSKSQFEEEHKMVGFVVGNVRYSVDIMRIREIVNPGDLVHIPAVPSHVVGVADHREVVVPIIDLRIRFGLEEIDSNRRAKWIVVKMETMDVGLQVDRVTQVLKVTDSQLRDRDSLLDDGGAPWIKEVFSDENGLVFELDLEAVVGSVAELPVSDVSDVSDELGGQ